MTDDHHTADPKSQPIEPEEDADTAAARKELKQTVISEKTAGAPAQTDRTTPDSSQEELMDQLSSPKKKRARDQVEDDGALEEGDSKSVASSDSAKDRAARLEPEKKRARDEVTTETESAEPSAKPSDATVTIEKDDDKTTTVAAESKEKGKDGSSEPSTSAFASSGFAKLAFSTASPFGALGGAAGKTSVFGSPAASASPFASSASPQKPAAPAPIPTLSFGSSSSSSPFASAKTGGNGFGSVLGGGGGFGSSALSGKALTSFAKPGETFKSVKPAKPFGAPESDAEEASDDGEEGEDESNKSEADDKEGKDDSDKEEVKRAEEKKRKLHRVTVDDGEAGEATVLAVRAKIYYLDKEAGWKERGSGMLKINVPEACVDFEDGNPVPGSFDASCMEDDEDGEDKDNEGGTKKRKVVRLLMRQDNTHRVLLNTVMLPAQVFKEKAGMKAVGIIFTAFEGAEAKPTSVQARMSAASAKSFLNEISIIQRELAGM
ncbi:PH domain-like protein [Sodiomyces alkalinus F11]|uniref:PH domain-like protein n=1 Tax=Sodiomyces alkalinus (strain CBS 110278 / VKM F-3762 / F11) TaxID=1314773 RepID=A0A3N2PW29_SODAK|nr:PH domain-like protein [Sodiomyces alkalinus F11]ROT38705.1 PH domain-like protein [Sodiomyces alkalinus F11]